MMHIYEENSQKNIAVQVIPAEIEDFKILNKKDFFFNWRRLRRKTEIFKLCISSNKNIIGVIALETFWDEKRVEIILLAKKRENETTIEKYVGIADCLIAFTCKNSVLKFGSDACVSLVPKTKLVDYYIKKFNMKIAGRHLFLEGTNLFDIISKNNP